MIGLIIDILCGVIFMYLGYSIGTKGNIKLIHSYHYKNVTDKEGYTNNMGIGCYILGVGFLAVDVLSYMGYSVQSGYMITVVIIVGLLWMLRTQIKYNGGIF